MSLNVNGTEIETVIFNGTEIQKVICNESTVYEGIKEYTEQVNVPAYRTWMQKVYETGLILLSTTVPLQRTPKEFISVKYIGISTDVTFVTSASDGFKYLYQVKGIGGLDGTPTLSDKYIGLPIKLYTRYGKSYNNDYSGYITLEVTYMA